MNSYTALYELRAYHGWTDCVYSEKIFLMVIVMAMYRTHVLWV